MPTNISKFQKFKTVTINRKQILNAPYNPRKINSANYILLLKNIKRVGLIETLVWNITTGNIVSGHQRLKISDELEQRDDYDLDVAQVEQDLKTEKEQNIFMNNPNGQGEWNRDLLLQIAPEIDMKMAGFTDVDMSILGVEFNLESHQNEKVENIINEFDRINAQNKTTALESAKKNEQHKDWKSVKNDIRERDALNSGETYIVLTFDTVEKKETFLSQFGFEPDDRYIKGEILQKFIRECQ
jgi:hypothetical protein